MVVDQAQERGYEVRGTMGLIYARSYASLLTWACPLHLLGIYIRKIAEEPLAKFYLPPYGS